MSNLAAASPNLLGWWVGYGIGAVLVIVVAALLLVIIATARAIAATARDITRSLAEARDRTEALWQVSTTNQVATEILRDAAAARRSLR